MLTYPPVDVPPIRSKYYVEVRNEDLGQMGGGVTWHGRGTSNSPWFTGIPVIISCRMRSSDIPLIPPPSAVEHLQISAYFLTPFHAWAYQPNDRRRSPRSWDSVIVKAITFKRRDESCTSCLRVARCRTDTYVAMRRLGKYVSPAAPRSTCISA